MPDAYNNTNYHSLPPGVESKLTKECKDHHVDIFDEKMTVPRCQSEAMINFPKWTEEHPGWWIKSWRCTQTETDNRNVQEQDI